MCRARGSRCEEVVDLTLSFYRRNYIEGLFLSSGIIQSADYTMEQLVARGAVAARGARVSRLHPSQDDSRGERRADRGGRPIRRPAERQHRAAGPRCARRRWRRRRPTASIKRAMGEIRLKLDEAKEGGSEGAEVLAGRAEHADHRRRGSEHRRCDPRHGGYAVPLVSAEARLLLGVQPDSAFFSTPAESRAAADARASAVSGGLAAAVLRLLARRAGARDAERPAGPGARSQDGLGARESRAVSRGCEHRRAASAAARARARA